MAAVGLEDRFGCQFRGIDAGQRAAQTGDVAVRVARSDKAEPVTFRQTIVDEVGLLLADAPG